jgi:hypothetical protein
MNGSTPPSDPISGAATPTLATSTMANIFKSSDVPVKINKRNPSPFRKINGLDTNMKHKSVEEELSPRSLPMYQLDGGVDQIVGVVEPMIIETEERKKTGGNIRDRTVDRKGKK